MSKKVQYAIGAVGLVPALGLLAQPAVAASAHTSVKRDNATTCYGNTYHHAVYSGQTLTFWSARVGSRRCIGTIEVSGVSPVVGVGAYVHNAYGDFCFQDAGGSHLTDVCRRVFRTNGLKVVGFRTDNFGFRHYVSVAL